MCSVLPLLDSVYSISSPRGRSRYRRWKHNNVSSYLNPCFLPWKTQKGIDFYLEDPFNWCQSNFYDRFIFSIVVGLKVKTHRAEDNFPRVDDQRRDFVPVSLKAKTTPQSIMNAKLSHLRFWHCRENGLIKTIQTGSSRQFKRCPTTYIWVSSQLY